MSKVPIYVIIIVIAFVVGLIRYRYLKPQYIRLFIPFLAITAFVELATPLKFISFKGNNHWFFNTFTVLEFVFYFYIFYLLLKNKNEKKIAIYSIPLFLLIAAVNIFFIQGVNKFHTISYRIGAVMVIVGCFFYFRQLLQSKEDIVLIRNSFFWISTGLLFFYLGFFFYMSAFDYIVYKNIRYNRELWKIISRSLNVLLYSFCLIAFLCPKDSKT